MKRRVAIIGGGLAGLAAAVRLVEEDCAPVIIETRRKLGGRATSFTDPRTGELLDNCQHVLMGCCSNLIDLYQRTDVLGLIEWHETLHWTAGGGTVYTMKPLRLPAPMHMARSLNQLGFLGPAERICIRKAIWRIIRMGTRGRLGWRGRAFSELMIDLNQTDRSIELFWRPIIVSACNLAIDRVDASHGLQVFQDGFLSSRWAGTIGLATVPLVDLYDPIAAHIARHGGEFHLGCSARGIGFDGSRVTGVITGDGVIEAAAVVAAIPPDRLRKLTTNALQSADTRLQHLESFEYSPILGVHLRFDQQIMPLDLPHVTLVDHATHWLFNKGVDDQGNQHLHAVVSAADDWMEFSEEQIVEHVMNDVHDVFPGARGLLPVSARSVKEKRATFAATPQAEMIRPSSAPGFVGTSGGGVKNLYLAGDWCDTGWPATMEGAVRSGYAAAGAVLDRELLVPDVPPSWLAGCLGL